MQLAGIINRCLFFVRRSLKGENVCTKKRHGSLLHNCQIRAACPLSFKFPSQGVKAKNAAIDKAKIKRFLLTVKF